MNFKKHDVQWTDAKISRFWDHVSSNALLCSKYFGSRVGTHAVLTINRHIKFKNIHKILDMSCGAGDVIYACLPFLRRGQHIYGTDFSKENVTYTNNRLKHAAQFKKAYVLQGYPSRFSDGFFNLIILTEVVEHLDDAALEAMFNEAMRLLTPGGFLFVTTPNDEHLDENKVLCPDCGCFFHRWQHVRKWTHESLAQQLEQFSFMTITSRTIAWGPSRPKRVALKIAVMGGLIRPDGIYYVGRKPG